MARQDVSTEVMLCLHPPSYLIVAAYIIKYPLAVSIYTVKAAIPLHADKSPLICDLDQYCHFGIMNGVIDT